MSQRFLYGPYYTALNPPKEWETVGVDSTPNDSLIEAAINTNEFTFVGRAAEFLKDWRDDPGKGIGNGVPFRIEYSSNKTNATSILFDGYIDLSTGRLNSQVNPVIYQCLVVETEKPRSVIEKMAVLSQGVLLQKLVIGHTDFVDCPVILESKKNIAERTLILYNFGSKVVISFAQIINNILSSLSNVLGLSVLIGIVQILVTFVHAVIIINRLLEEGKKIAELFFPIIHYYKAFNLGHMIRKGFEYRGYTVDYGTLESFLDNVYILPSQQEENGYPIQNVPVTGICKPQDFGYTIGELIDGLAKITNARSDVRDGVVWIKNRLDPDWEESPLYTPDQLLIKTVTQYSNGIYHDDTERLKATVMVNFQYDTSDCHTLTDKSGDSHEIHRELINELNTKMNTLKGIQEVEIPWAMCVRKAPFDNLWDLFTGISGEFDMYLNQIKDKVTEYFDTLSSYGIGAYANSILAQSGLGGIINERAGALKIDDNAFAIPKIVYLTQTDAGLRIPENFKDFIGAGAIYTNYYLGESPADVNDFKGQWRIVESLSMRWSYEKFIQAKTNPAFNLSGLDAKFRYSKWAEAKHKSEAEIEINEPFDENITETEI